MEWELHGCTMEDYLTVDPCKKKRTTSLWILAKQEHYITMDPRKNIGLHPYKRAAGAKKNVFSEMLCLEKHPKKARIRRNICRDVLPIPRF